MEFPCEDVFPSERLTVLHSFFKNGEFSVRNLPTSVTPFTIEFDPFELQDRFRRVCDDFLDPVVETTPSASLSFCGKILFEVNPYFRHIRTRQANSVFRFPDDSVNKTVVVVPYKTMLPDDESVFVERENEITLKITMAQAVFLAMLIFGKMIDFYHDRLLLTPLARSIFVDRHRITQLSAELGINFPQVMKLLNASCASGAGHYLEESDASCALVVNLCSTKDIPELPRRRSVIIKLMKPYLERELIPDLERALIFEKYAAPDVKASDIRDIMRAMDEIDRHKHH